ncbi:hypothetical protein, variant 2 [Allomyces macrogynus ATCC 38327]|nr:hypothetical protein, variant 2 [Allomyces macrogynus ATCC 38327]|eukprot:KNE68312.1 hypothetical protein, variant 2 [Allomyces macrogynus ATCC 38327]
MRPTIRHATAETRVRNRGGGRAPTMLRALNLGVTRRSNPWPELSHTWCSHERCDASQGQRRRYRPSLVLVPCPFSLYPLANRIVNECRGTNLSRPHDDRRPSSTPIFIALDHDASVCSFHHHQPIEPIMQVKMSGDAPSSAAAPAAAPAAGQFFKAPRGIYLDRFNRFTSTDMFQDVNLFGQMYGDRASGPDALDLAVLSVPDGKRISFEEAVKGEFKPTRAGERFGPSWSTHWFKVKCTIPASWKGESVVFVFNAESAEGQIYSPTGELIHGLSGGGWGDTNRRTDYIIARPANGGEVVEFYVEMACNGLFGNGEGGMIAPPSENRYYTLQEAHIAVWNEKAQQLRMDWHIIRDMARELDPTKNIRSQQALYTANQIMDAWYTGQGFDACLAIAREFLAVPAEPTAVNVTSVGHCHIDTAWLWPYDETKRKVARSWSTQIYFMDEYPEYRFVASQAQQFTWLKEQHPALFEKLQTKVASGQFLPIGGSWVEMDGNLPSGESFVRQFLYGQRFFVDHFAKRSKIMFVPDTFGYSAQLPQIARLAGTPYFFTQKLSWNNINKFPHTTFVWESPDGTGLLTHFCPADTYTGQATVGEVVKHVTNHKDLATTTSALYLFGNGDGGGGPTRDMLDRHRRMGAPTGTAGLGAILNPGDPTEFYREVAQSSLAKLARWRGELYFELHRGVMTTHALVKRRNRQCEALMRNVEFVWAVSVATGKCKPGKYPREGIDRCWQKVLLNQFHDVLPGSSIGAVYVDAHRIYEEVLDEAGKLLESGVDVLVGVPVDTERDAWVAVNGLSHARTEIVEVPVRDGVQATQVARGGETALCVAQVDAMGVVHVDPAANVDLPPLSARQDGDYVVLENDYVRYTFNARGQVVEGYDKRADRVFVDAKKPANTFAMFSDVPLFWDAWDVEFYHFGMRTEATNGTCTLSETGPLRVSVAITVHVSSTSTLTQTASLTPYSPNLVFDTSVSWHESHQLLKVEFPLEIVSDVANYEVPYAVIQRPTHANTSWDLARFEVCAHKFADLSEYGYGVAILSDAKYGFSCRGSTLSMSILRAPKSPDKDCDIGDYHRFRYAIAPHVGRLAERTVLDAAAFNSPLVLR